MQINSLYKIKDYSHQILHWFVTLALQDKQLNKSNSMNIRSRVAC